MEPIVRNGLTWTPTTTSLPSIGSCIICEQPIEGEDARYYEREVAEVKAEVSGGRTMPARTIRIRKHFIVSH